MKTRSHALLAATLALTLNCAHAQFTQPGGAQGFRFNGSMAKLFGENGNFSANVEVELKGGALAEPVRMPGKIAVADGKSRFDMDVTQIRGGGVPEASLEQMKTMGMDKTVMISRPDKKMTYMIYPTLKSHLEMPMAAKVAAEKDSDFKIETTELGKETVDGHPCVKTKAVVTDNAGEKHEATLWNATDLKKFPVKVEKTEDKTLVTMLFKDVKLAKPDASMFEPPASSARFDNMQALMQDIMAKRFNQGPAPAK